MSAAVTTPGPSLRMRASMSEISPCRRATSPLRFRMMSVTSSRTPLIDENSCATPSILTDVTAVPSIVESSTRRSELP